MNLKEEAADAAVTITFNRPQSLNALDAATGDQLLDALRRCGADGGVRAVVLRGEGRAFCSGGDVRSMEQASAGGPDALPRFFLELAELYHACVLEIARMPKPVMAAVNGSAAGAGFSLILACDYRLSTTAARFSGAYTRLGVTPDLGATYYLPRYIGLGRTLDFYMMNRPLTAREAFELGILSELVEPEGFDSAVRARAAELAALPTLAVARLKALLLEGSGEGLASALEGERTAISECSKSADFVEGFRAFISKRPPSFKGH